MPNDEPIELWWLNEAERYRNIQTAGEAFAGEHNASSGLAGVRQLVLEEASQSITDRIDTGTSKVAAFNYESSDWPHKARAWLARYEQLNTDRPDDEYTVESYADAASIPEEIEMQTTLSRYREPNPFDAYEPDVARAVLQARMIEPECDDERVINEMESPESFMDALQDVGNVEAALHRQHYDTHVPGRVLQEAAPPDEWESDPSNIQRGACRVCGDALYDIETGDGAHWVADDGTVHEQAVDVQENGRYAMADAATTNTLVCGPCGDRWDQEPHAGVIKDDAIVAGRFMDSMIRASAQGDPPSELTQDELRAITELMQSGDTGIFDLFAATPSGSLPSETPVILAELDAQPDEGRAFFARGQIFIHRNDPDAAREVKHVLQEHMADHGGVPA